MPYVELSCVFLLGLGVVLRARAPGFGEWRRAAPIVFVAAWIGENSSIRAYDFYRYSPDWHGFLDATPLLIPAIWVFVILSARDIARKLAPAHVVAAAYALVLFDATFIEPICTSAGLWKWNAPGPFEVPYIGIVGWTFFGGSLVFCLEKLKRRWLSVLVAPLMLHALLVCSWWGGFKWLGALGSSSVAFTAACWALSLSLLVACVVRGRQQTVELSFILPRLGPAAFFFALLTAYRAPPLLWLFAAAFVAPWMVLTRWRPEPVLGSVAP